MAELREALRRAGIIGVPEGYQDQPRDAGALTLPAACPRCGGTGRIYPSDGGPPRRCQCWYQALLERELRKTNIPNKFLRARFDLVDTVSLFVCRPVGKGTREEADEPFSGRAPRRSRRSSAEGGTRLYTVYEMVEKPANAFFQTYLKLIWRDLAREPRTQMRSIIFSGAPGSGKTYAACAIGVMLVRNSVLRRERDRFNYRVYYLKASDYLQLRSEAMNPNPSISRPAIERIHSLLGMEPNPIHFLIFDEAGMEYHSETEWALTQIKDLIRHRAERCLPTAITTNKIWSQLEDLYQEEVVSTFHEDYYQVFIQTQDDHRIHLAQRLMADLEEAEKLSDPDLDLDLSALAMPDLDG